MKSMTKKVVALSATFAMAASFAASAATISGVTATANSADDITVTYTHDIAADGQATILVYEGETPFAGGTGDNVGYINQDAATGSFTFAMRDTLVPQTGSKEFKVLVGGTDVATAGTATFALGTAAPAGFTATFEDDGAAFGDAIKGTEITLPALPTKNPNTRYYWGWIIDGDDSGEMHKAGEKIAISADTKFIAKHFPKGDMTFDGEITAEEANIAYYMDVKDKDGVLDMGYEPFWTDEDPNGAIVGDMTFDGEITAEEANIAYYMDVKDTAGILDMGYDQFWED